MKPRNRRTFLDLAAGAAGGVLAAAPTAQAATALSQDRVAGANPRVRVALIGCGGQGGGDLRNALRSGAQVVALCDVDVVGKPYRTPWVLPTIAAPTTAAG